MDASPNIVRAVEADDSGALFEGGRPSDVPNMEALSCTFSGCGRATGLLEDMVGSKVCSGGSFTGEPSWPPVAVGVWKGITN